MALNKAQDFLGSESPLEVYERIEDGRLTGLVQFKVGETSIKGYKNAISQFLEVSYVVPELSKEVEKKLSNALKNINKSSYAVYPTADEAFKRMGLNKIILIPFAGTRERRNLESMSKINEILGFPDYENSKNRLYKEKKTAQKKA